MSKIDAVILWVDDHDQNWLNEKKKFESNISDKNEEQARYRDWDCLKYWFRAIEKNGDFFNHIYFITWGHVPKWLNVNNDKLKIINHKDYIPSKYLPTFNSNVIELNLFRIKDLSENFVLFNDDFYLINKCASTDFFMNEVPCESFCEKMLYTNDVNDKYAHALLNNMALINKKYNKRSVYKKNLGKLINFKYGFKDNFQTCLMSFFPKFGLIDSKHLPVALKKSVLRNLWKENEYDFDQCCLNKFRNYNDVTQYLVRFTQLCDGNFVPRSNKIGMYFDIGDDIKKIINKIEKKKYKMVCLNDTKNVNNFDESKKILIGYFEKKFPVKSKFEK